MMNSQAYKSIGLPDSPGVYYFLGQKKEILYVGKATSLKDRVKSYFGKDLILTRGPLLVRMVEEAKSISFKPTDSVLEAMMLEAFEIKRHQPYFNSKAKDDKSYNFVTITDEDFPKVVVTRGAGTYGPFPHAGELKEALKIIRKIFPYRDEKCTMKKKCFNAQIGLCPGVCAGLMNKTEYRKVVRKIKMFFEAKKTELIKTLDKEMKALAKSQKFEEAERVKRQIFALEHIHDMALIKRDIERDAESGGSATRIEAYDIAHLSGKDTVGVMVVVEDGERAPSQYRKFKIKLDKNDDVGNLKEVLTRRLNHPEWRMPDIVVIDGGVGQINAAKEVLKDTKLSIVAVVKDDKHQARDIVGDKETIKKWEKSILLANAEAHRFAIGYHRKLRNKGFRI
jgi:excinuclease ABC subunit C